MTEKQATDVVVIGAGYAGLMAAMRIATKTDRRTVAVTLVSASPNFNERVRNHQLLTGQRIPEHRLADLVAKTRIRFEQGTVTGLDLKRRIVTVEPASRRAARARVRLPRVCPRQSCRCRLDPGGP